MFDDDDGRSVVDKALEYLQQCLYIRRMQAYGRFIEHEYRVFLPPSHLAGKLQPLGLSS